MAQIEVAIKDAIMRGARRQIRLVTRSLRRDVRRLRQHVGQLRLSITSLREAARQWTRVTQADGWTPQVSEEELKTARLSPRLIQKLRARLGLSRAALARLLKASTGAIVGWESGRSEPSEPHRKGLVALRKLGRRDAKRLLSALPKASGSRPRTRRRGGSQRKARVVARRTRLKRGGRRSR